MPKYSHRRFLSHQGWLKIQFLTVLLSSTLLCTAQKDSGWDILNMGIVVRVPSEWSAVEEEKIVKTPELVAFENTIVSLKGYVIPIEWTSHEVIILSRFPFQSCFFCGAAGPQTVIEVYLKSPRKFKADEPVTVQGRLRFNETDPLRLFFVLESADVL